MRFALLGTHPDGLEMACALVESGRHELIAYTAAAVPEEVLRRWGPAVRRVGDLEEVLADPAVEAVVVAGAPAHRPAQLRRALQSERHVLCVHPADRTPDVAYEAAMIRDDVHKVLLPILPDALHPGVIRLATLLHEPTGPVGVLHLLEMERWATGPVLLASAAEDKPSLPGWDVLRALGGEVAEVAAFATAEDVTADQPVLVSGRFEGGGLFRASYLPGQAESRLRYAALGSRGRVELLFPLGWPGPAFLSWRDEAAEMHEEAWDVCDPWPALVAGFEAAIAGQSPLIPDPIPLSTGAKGDPRWPSWQDEIRALELDDATRRGVERRRASTMEYPEATEEAGFKGTMTLVGCGLLWGLFVLVIVANWVPALFWAVIPLVLLFLVLQVLRWVVPGGRGPGQTTERR